MHAGSNRTEQLATWQELHWSITSIVNRPFNSRLLLTARRAVYGINSLFNGLVLPITAFGSEDDYLKGAQRRFSSIVHHAAWLNLLRRLRGQDVEAARGMAPSAAPVAASPREAARFISVPQAYAGAFLNAVPRQP
eukprot:scaffold14035_cov67-Phaeocystis_antarctica.AAC.1